MKTGIVHYRAGRTDGVSLEIAKRKMILKSMGHTVRIISGPVSQGSDLTIPELEFDSPEIREIKENSFSFFCSSSLSERALMERISAVSDTIRDQFLDYHEREGFDALLVHNVFSHGRHIAAAKAFAEIAENLAVPVISTDHDWYWERPEYQTPRFQMIADFLEQHVPPHNQNITHVCINSLARDQLKERTGINAYVLPDIFDFGQNDWVIDAFNKDLPGKIHIRNNDLAVVQATRIVERKNIETAIHLVKKLEKIKPFLVGKQLYNGKILAENSEIALVLAGYPELSSTQYLVALEELATKCGVNVRFVHELIASERSSEPEKTYSLRDVYAHADLVTYPSLQEGWGNQFIEAVFARKPVILFEYPVYQADIKPEGYFAISLGDKIEGYDDNGLVIPNEASLDQACSQLCYALISETTPILLEENWQIGQRNHGPHVMQQFLEENL